jgi:hypothetical protein
MVAQCSTPPSEPANSVICDKRDGSERSFDGIVVDLDASVIDEADQAFSARQGVSDQRAKLAFLTDQAEFCAQPLLECVGELCVPKT